MKIRVDWTNQNEFVRDMSLFAKQLNYTLAKEIEPDMKARFHIMEKNLFQGEGASGKHGKWASLSPQYRKWKARKYPGQPIMVLAGNLRASLIGATAESIFNTTKSGNKFVYEMGTDVNRDGFDYPTYHQKKAKKKRRTIDMTNKDTTQFGALIARHIYGMAKRSKVWDKVTSMGNAEFDRGVPGA